MNHPQLHFYGLLHLDSREKTAMNVGVKDFNHQRAIYNANALTLARSLSFSSQSFTLLTNSKAQLGALPEFISCKEIPFSLQIPAGTNFFSAHHKIDVFRFLVDARDGYHILCDLDVICIHSVPRSLLNLVESGIPIAYGISFLLHLPYDKLLLAEASRWPDNQLRSFTSRYEMLLHSRNNPFHRLQAKAGSLRRRFIQGA